MKPNCATVFSSSRLVYSAYSRCPCGAGLAYVSNPSVREVKNDPAKIDYAYWDCGDILRGIASKDTTHTGQLPFSFYEIKSEHQSSAHGATTRPTI